MNLMLPTKMTNTIKFRPLFLVQKVRVPKRESWVEPIPYKDKLREKQPARGKLPGENQANDFPEIAPFLSPNHCPEITIDWSHSQKRPGEKQGRKEWGVKLGKLIENILPYFLFLMQLINTYPCFLYVILLDLGIRQ